MPEERSLDYICYLEDKWKNRLRKRYDPRNADYRKKEEEARETIDAMKNQTEVGIMLYQLFYNNCSKAEEELKAYTAYLRKQR